MIILFVLFILNIIFTWSLEKSDKEKDKWLENAKKEYEKENGLKSLYPKSDIFFYKNHYKYFCPFHFIISIWLILIVLPFFLEPKVIVIIYLFNYMYSRIVNYLGNIELKIDAIKKEVYKENDDL